MTIVDGHYRRGLILAMTIFAHEAAIKCVESNVKFAVGFVYRELIRLILAGIIHCEPEAKA